MELLQRLRRAVSGPAQGDRVQAVWNGATLAESDRTVVVEGNHYFPPEDVERAYLEDSSRQTVCPWKGVAHYYAVTVDGERNEAAAWYYPEPSAAASKIRDHVAFSGGIRVITAGGGA
jgi:uncharacterized protein (DUF427 family)